MLPKICQTSLVKLLKLFLLLWSTTTLCQGDELTTTIDGNETITNSTNYTLTHPLGVDLNSHSLSGNITILHEVHDGSYSTKKDRADILPLKPTKKKLHTLLDKVISPVNYEKSKRTKLAEPVHSMVFDFNLGDLEDLEPENLGRDNEEKILSNNTNNDRNSTTNNNNTLKLYKTAIAKEEEKEEQPTNPSSKIGDLNVQVDLTPATYHLNTTTHPTVTSSSISYSFTSSVVTISPHIFKVSKSKSLKKGRELLKRDDLQKSSNNNNHNSILHYFNEFNENDVIGPSNATFDNLHSANIFHVLVNLYDHFYWQSADIRTKVSTGCGLEMQAYLTGLHGNYYWAQKAYDASGHYRGQLFFGNDKWLGQKPFCYELNRQLEQDSRKHFEFEFFTALITLQVWLPERLVLNLQLGECLPKSCSAQDVQHILDLDPHTLMLKALNAYNSSNTTLIKILRVRTVPGIYSYWSELKFQIFASFMVSILILVVAATWYQSKLNERLLSIEPSISIISQRMDTGLAQHMATESQYGPSKSFELYQMSNLNENENNNHNNDNVVPEIVENSSTKRPFTNGSNSNNNNNGHHNSTQALTNGDNSTVNDIEYKIEENPCRRSISQGTYNVKPQLGLHEQLLLCFAFQTNANQILNVDDNRELQTSCVHGLRVISVLWTIMVHTYLQIFSIGENRFRRIIVERSPFYQIVGNATFSVDTFFFISGFLVTLLFLKMDKKYPENTGQFLKKGFMDTLVMFVYRYIRLTPAYLFVIFFSDFALRQTFDNSIFQPTVPPNTCNQFWWRNILYVNNFYPLSEICMIWSWYMANEMQFYIMATILLILSMKFFKLVVLIVIAFLLSSWGIAGMMSLRHHYTHKVSNPFESFDFLYDKPWQRVGTYLIGMLTGYIISKTKTAPKLSKCSSNLLWLGSLGLMALIIFGVWRGQLDEITTSFYVSVGHTAFSLGLVWIVLACCWGLAPTVNRILSYRCLWPLSRLTYCAYLIHPVIMLITAYRMDGTVHLNNVLVMIIFLGNSVVSFIAAFFISVLMEAPVIRLLKIIFYK